MCRHLAYLGPPASLQALLIDPPHSLYRQAWAPRRQRHGTVNADGFGIGWYAGADPVPARYRRGEPIWGDPSLPDIARVTSSGAVLAAVRSATPGTAAGPEAAAPFGSGPWLFSHNGAAQGWRVWGEAAFRSWAGASSPTLGAVTGGAAGAPGPLPAGRASNSPFAGGVPTSPFAGREPTAPSAGGAPASPSAAEAPGLLPLLEALTDSALLWALALQRLRAGLPLAAALARVIGAVEAAGGTGRLNLLLTDGRSVAATAYGDTLWYRQSVPPATGPPAHGGDGGASVTVASEPDDDEPGWTEVPDRHLLTATRSLVRVRPLSDLSAIGPAGHDSAQPADRLSPQPAGHGSRQPADRLSPQSAGHGSRQPAGHVSTQPADHVSTQATTSAPKGS